MTTKKIIGSIKVSEADYGKAIYVGADGSPEFRDVNGVLIDTLVMSSVVNTASARTDVPSSIAGVVTNVQTFGGDPSNYWYAGDLDDFNMSSTKTYDSNSTYLVKIEMSQLHSNGSSGAIFYGVKPQDAASDVVNIGAHSSRSGGSGHGYAFGPLTASGVFNWKPTTTGTLTLTFTALQAGFKASSVIVQIFKIA